MTYTLSRTERWNRAALIGATVVVWLIAAWLLADTLAINYAHLRSTLSTARPIWTSGMLLPVWLIVIVLIAAPVLVWHLLLALTLRLHIDQHGLNVSRIGKNQLYRWDQVIAVVPASGQYSDDVAVVIRTAAQADAAAQSFQRVKLDQGIADRDTLIEQIRERIYFHAATTSELASSNP